MKVYIERTKEKKTLKFEGETEKLLNKLEINKETVIVVRNDSLVTLDAVLKNSDSIRILSVISGG